MAFNRVVFPAPDGPIIAVTYPDLQIPETPFRICFYYFSLIQGHNKEHF